MLMTCPSFTDRPANPNRAANNLNDNWKELTKTGFLVEIELQPWCNQTSSVGPYFLKDYQDKSS